MELQYGRSGMDPMSFDVPNGQDVDVCFVKNFVATKAVEIGPIEQFENFSSRYHHHHHHHITQCGLL